MYTNLMGDYIKGSKYSEFPVTIQQGIVLHRHIDHYIDTHPSVLKLLKELYPSLPKISGIAVDLYFDHLLAKNWGIYSDVDLHRFVQDFYLEESAYEDFFPFEFRFMLSKMKENNWLEKYQSFEGLTTACHQLSRRIPFDNALALAPEVFKQKEQVIQLAFDSFMKDAIPHFQKYFEKQD
jgi:acyl carrier protein phosphodiesterase